jgi:hypothetical protein
VHEVIRKESTPEDELDARVDAILAQIDLTGWAVLANGVATHLQTATQEAGRETLLTLGMSETEDADLFGVVNQGAVDYAASRGAEMVGMRIDDEGNLWPNPDAKWRIDDGTRQLLRATIKDAIESGASPGELREAIVSDYAFSPARALNIARTETARAFESASLEAAKKSGVVTGKESDLGSGHPEPDECDDNADAGVIGLDEDFPSGDPCAPFHPGCECATRYVVADEGAAET